MIDINISYGQARQTVENMSALTDSDIEEVSYCACCYKENRES